MFYPSGKVPNGKMVICLKDSKPEIDEVTMECDESCMLECIREWLDETQCCAECWQLNEYLQERGVDVDVNEHLNEDGAAAAAAPGPGFATLGNTPGMGQVQAPMNGGTNAGFYNNSLNGSGDKFPSLTAGTPAAKAKQTKSKIVKNYLEFMKRKKSRKK